MAKTKNKDTTPAVPPFTPRKQLPEKIASLLRPYPGLIAALILILNGIRYPAGFWNQLLGTLVHMYDTLQYWKDPDADIHEYMPWISQLHWPDRLIDIIKALMTEHELNLDENPWADCKSIYPILYVICDPTLRYSLTHGDNRFRASNWILGECFCPDEQTVDDYESLWEDCVEIIKNDKRFIGYPANHRSITHEPRTTAPEQMRFPGLDIPTDDPLPGKEGRARIYYLPTARQYDDRKDNENLHGADQCFAVVDFENDEEAPDFVTGWPMDGEIINPPAYVEEEKDQIAWRRDSYRRINDYNAIQGQYLPNDTNKLDPYQTGEAIEYLWQRDQENDNTLQTQQGVLAAWFTLFTMLTLGAIAKLKIHTPGNTRLQPTTGKPPRRQYPCLTTAGELIIPCPKPINALGSEPAIAKETYACEKRLTLTLPRPFPTLLQQGLDKVRHDASLEGHRLEQVTSINTQTIRDDYDAMLGELRYLDDCITPGRFESALAWQIVQVTDQDLAQMFWIAGVDGSTAHPSTYYKNMDVEKVQDTYTRTCKHMMLHARLSQSHKGVRHD